MANRFVLNETSYHGKGAMRRRREAAASRKRLYVQIRIW